MLGSKSEEINAEKSWVVDLNVYLKNEIRKMGEWEILWLKERIFWQS